jgi:hypothetical protein
MLPATLRCRNAELMNSDGNRSQTGPRNQKLNIGPAETHSGWGTSVPLTATSLQHIHPKLP